MDRVIYTVPSQCFTSNTWSPKLTLVPTQTAKRDGKEWFEKEGASAEMQALNRKFGILHGVTASLNLTSFFATLAYGFTLARRLQ